jgi:hypothetical protein
MVLVSSCWGGGGGLCGGMSSSSSSLLLEPDSLTAKEMIQKLQYILGQHQKREQYLMVKMNRMAQDAKIQLSQGNSRGR